MTLLKNKYKKLGISGGTFDPIHHGHLIIAEEIREAMGLDKMLFIPSGNPPHKVDMKVTPGNHRFNMVKLAVEGNPYFEVSPMEVEREGYSYTIDTLHQLKELYGKKTSLFFMTGADVIPKLITWKNFENLFSLCEFVAVLRPGFERKALIEEIQDLKRKHKAIIHIIDTPLIGISSTIVREKIRNNKSVKYLIPEKVEHYIRENDLYKLK